MFLTVLNLYLGLIVGLAINIYGIWLLYNALVYALKGKPETSRIIMYVLIILVVLFSLVGLGAKSKADKFMREFNNSEINR
jgi:divalent metal cation (Fe/Co/Zn/Cd) transporter